MTFGYFPDYRGVQLLKDFYLRLVGFPYPSRRIEAKTVLGLLGPVNNKVVIDIGCGDGVWTNEISKLGGKVIGVDVDGIDLMTALERSKKLKLKTQFLGADGRSLPINGGKVDAVVSISTIEHIAYEKRIFAEASRVLKPNGLLVVSVPTSRVLVIPSWLTVLPAWIKRRLFKTPVVKANRPSEYQREVDLLFRQLRTYDLKELKSKASKYGFELVASRYVVSLFSVLPQSIYHSLRIFEWEKKLNTRYRFNSELVFALVFGLFYPWYLLDSLFRFQFGHCVCVGFKKPNHK